VAEATVVTVPRERTTPNKRFDRSAKRQRRLVPLAPRAPAPGQAWRWALRMRRLCTAISLATTLVSSGASAAENQVFMGPGYAFGVSAPDGWVGEKPDFAPVLFHPSRFSGDVSPVVIYVRPVSKAEVGAATPAQLNAIDLKGMRAQWPQIRSGKAGELHVRSKEKVPTYNFSGGRYFERVAYVDHPKAITVIVLSAETKENFSSSVAAFEHVVSSYQWLPELASTK
jgi:hypothetical protein